MCRPGLTIMISTSWTHTHTHTNMRQLRSTEFVGFLFTIWTIFCRNQLIQIEKEKRGRDWYYILKYRIQLVGNKWIHWGHFQFAFAMCESAAARAKPRVWNIISTTTTTTTTHKRAIRQIANATVNLALDDDALGSIYLLVCVYFVCVCVFCRCVGLQRKCNTFAHSLRFFYSDDARAQLYSIFEFVHSSCNMLLMRMRWMNTNTSTRHICESFNALEMFAYAFRVACGFMQCWYAHAWTLLPDNVVDAANVTRMLSGTQNYEWCSILLVHSAYNVMLFLPYSECAETTGGMVTKIDGDELTRGECLFDFFHPPSETESFRHLWIRLCCRTQPPIHKPPTRRRQRRASFVYALVYTNEYVYYVYVLQWYIRTLRMWKLALCTISCAISAL